jgi:hypothetical protein
MSISYAGTIALFMDSLIDETPPDMLLNLFVITRIITITSTFSDTKIIRLSLRLTQLIALRFSEEFIHQ